MMRYTETDAGRDAAVPWSAGGRGRERGKALSEERAEVVDDTARGTDCIINRNRKKAGIHSPKARESKASQLAIAASVEGYQYKEWRERKR